MGSNEQPAESAPSFTAVNGHPSTSPQSASVRNGDSHREDAPESNSRSSPPSSTVQSHVPSPATLYHSPVTQPPPNHPSRRDSAGDSKQSDNSSADSQISRNDAASPLKRKRSGSPDYCGSNGAVYHNHHLPPNPERQKGYDPNHERPPESRNGIAPVPYHPTHTQPGPRDHREQYHRQEYVSPAQAYQHPDRSHYDHHADPHAPAQQPRPYYSEAQMADALRRENGAYGPDSMGRRDSFASPDQDDPNHGHYDGEYGTPRPTASQMEIDRKRRKRVFSNRTKTGCMTCRRRKKKCDEQHPECKCEPCVLCLTR